MMTDNQRIHPANDLESQTKPTIPLYPRNTSKSDNRDPPIPKRHFPVRHSQPPKKKRSCCCRFLCYTFTILLILIIAISITIGILYLAFRPKLPKYSVDRLRIAQFNLSDNNNLFVTFDVTVTARNPNKKIGIYYVGGSNISALYKETELCEGSLPNFYQGHRNITVLNLPLTGQTQDATGLVSTLQQQLQEKGNLPLNIKVNQNVRVKFGKLKLFRVKFHVRCEVVVDSLGADNDISISDSSCKFKLRL
ncbi:NDR1/HIN1-like protein 6 [Vicia villosa]|uniref:NDR1/HIN1-like protein 6 n=1 Tax=Vicia villosa TaxID=3911 RepID=UPI00273C4040|nr:NDR1/HIN1-like protein 6 [Vicia villosa]